MSNYLERYSAELQKTLDGELFNTPNIMLIPLNKADDLLISNILGKRLEKVSDEEISEFLNNEIEKQKSSETVDESLKQEADQTVRNSTEKTNRAKPQMKSFYDSTIDVFSGAQNKENIVIPQLLRFDVNNDGFIFFEAQRNDISINLIVLKDPLITEDGIDNLNLQKTTRYIDDASSKLGRIHCLWLDCTQCSEGDIESIAIIVNALSEKNVSYGKILLLTPEEAFDPQDQWSAIGLEVCAIENVVETTLRLYTKEEAVASLESAKKYELDMMQQYAKRIILTFGASAGALGANPIPVSDAALIAPVQILMMKRIVDNYKLDDVVTLTGDVIVGVLISALGKSAASSIMKLFPGAGTVAGAVVGVTVATTFTLALGYVLSEICSEICTKILEGEDIDFSKSIKSDEIKRRTSEKFNALMRKNKEKNEKIDGEEDAGETMQAENPTSTMKSRFSVIMPSSKKDIICECGSKLKQNSKFCFNCGKAVTTRNTCSCGAKLKANMKFCSTCGKSTVS